MKIIVHEDRTLEIKNYATTQNENNVEEIEFEFPKKYQNWNKKIVFILENETEPVWDIIEDDKYIIPRAVTEKGQVELYIWLTHEEQDFRTETKPLYFNENIDAGEEITPEEIGAVNKILEQVDAALEEVDNIDINISKQGGISTVSIVRKDGTLKSVNILDGYTPQKGIDYYTAADKAEIENDINNDLAEYINQPFIEFEINNGNLLMEVKEYGSN